MMAKLREFRELFGDSNWSQGAGLLPAARQVPVPGLALTVAHYLGAILLAFAIFAGLAPWQQNVSGSGQVMEFSPNDRPQEIQATISGRVVRWHVGEGSRVVKGDVLVELEDNDPERLQRLMVQEQAAQSQLEAYRSQVIAYQERLEALERAQGAELKAAGAEVRVAREAVQSKREVLIAAQAHLDTAALQRRRIEDLAAQGLASQRELELSGLDVARSSARLQSQQAELRSAEAGLNTKEAKVESLRATTEASIKSAGASLRTAETRVAGAQASLMDKQSALARQQAQTVIAPRDGIIQRIKIQQGSYQVKQGQTLAHLVPDTRSRAVELYVDGNDASLIGDGRLVRIQFEGWPAIQMVGWPSVAVGTFGGTVAFVDPSDDGYGDFRVVVVPDANEEPWPDANFLRQGARVKGWVLLDTVPLGFEFWRQLNGFPPSLRRRPVGGALTLNKGSISGASK